jgi:hypothetical protein
MPVRALVKAGLSLYPDKNIKLYKPAGSRYITRSTHGPAGLISVRQGRVCFA